MITVGRAMLSAGLIVVLLQGCSAPKAGDSQPPATTAVESPQTTSTPPSVQSPPAPASADPSATTSATGGPPPGNDVTPSPASAVPTALPTVVPVPKVERSGTLEPSITASIVDIGGEVTYGDGVDLIIDGVTFGEETKKGPGSFPGREYAIFELQITNGSKETFSLDTVIVTVLDLSGTAVPPVYVEESNVVDFAGKLAPDQRASARYAFAVPNNSRSQVTVVVDFDDVHSSAVFHGKLS